MGHDIAWMTRAHQRHTWHKEGLLFAQKHSRRPWLSSKRVNEAILGKGSEMKWKLNRQPFVRSFPGFQDRPAGCTLGLGGNMTLLAPRRTLHLGACCGLAAGPWATGCTLLPGRSYAWASWEHSQHCIAALVYLDDPTPPRGPSGHTLPIHVDSYPHQ